MNPTNKLKVKLELVWWLFTAFVVVLILFPIWQIFEVFPFLVPNVLFIIGLVTYTRYTFLLEHTWLARIKYLKGALVFVSIPIIFFTVQSLHGLQVFLDENGKEALFNPEFLREPISSTRESAMALYIRREFFFFGVGLIFAALAFPLRMLISIWRQINSNKI